MLSDEKRRELHAIINRKVVNGVYDSFRDFWDQFNSRTADLSEISLKQLDLSYLARAFENTSITCVTFNNNDITSQQLLQFVKHAPSNIKNIDIENNEKIHFDDVLQKICRDRKIACKVKNEKLSLQNENKNEDKPDPDVDLAEFIECKPAIINSKSGILKKNDDQKKSKGFRVSFSDEKETPAPKPNH